MLSIGEFASATQLSPKALRLYDEQQLLPPASIDSHNGYRFYSSEQVVKGRLIRTLREMGLTLIDVGAILKADVHAERVLSQLAVEQDRRHAREKRAYYSALSMVRGSGFAHVPEIRTCRREACTVAVRSFQANRSTVFQQFQMAKQSLIQQLDHLHVSIRSDVRCALVDPLSEEPGRAEVLIPLVAKHPIEFENRSLPNAECAMLMLTERGAQKLELNGALDVIFDWFDRRALKASESPMLRVDSKGNETVEIEWAFEGSP